MWLYSFGMNYRNNCCKENNEIGDFAVENRSDIKDMFFLPNNKEKLINLPWCVY